MFTCVCLLSDIFHHSCCGTFWSALPPASPTGDANALPSWWKPQRWLPLPHNLQVCVCLRVRVCACLCVQNNKLENVNLVLFMHG